MNLIKFIEKESGRSYLQVIGMAAIVGKANVLLLAIITHAVQIIDRNEDLSHYFILYVLTFLLFLYTQWHSFERVTELIATAMNNFRQRLSSKLENIRSELDSNTVRRYQNQLLQHDALISQSLTQLTAAAQASILLVFALLYLAYLSFSSFLLLLVALLIACVFLFFQHQSIQQSLKLITNKQRQQAEANTAQKREKLSEQMHLLRLRLSQQESKFQGFGQIFVYALFLLLVFMMPSFNAQGISNIFKISATLLFIIGPLTMLVNVIPLLNRVNQVMEEIQHMEGEIDRHGQSNPQQSQQTD